MGNHPQMISVKRYPVKHLHVNEKTFDFLVFFATVCNSRNVRKKDLHADMHFRHLGNSNFKETIIAPLSPKAERQLLLLALLLMTCWSRERFVEKYGNKYVSSHLGEKLVSTFNNLNDNKII